MTKQEFRNLEVGDKVKQHSKEMGYGFGLINLKYNAILTIKEIKEHELEDDLIEFIFEEFNVRDIFGGDEFIGGDVRFKYVTYFNFELDLVSKNGK